MGRSWGSSRANPAKIPRYIPPPQNHRLGSRPFVANLIVESLQQQHFVVLADCGKTRPGRVAVRFGRQARRESRRRARLRIFPASLGGVGVRQTRVSGCCCRPAPTKAPAGAGSDQSISPELCGAGLRRCMPAAQPTGLRFRRHTAGCIRRCSGFPGISLRQAAGRSVRTHAPGANAGAPRIRWRWGRCSRPARGLEHSDCFFCIGRLRNSL